jgi:membrane associated rhomboid family serine protease
MFNNIPPVTKNILILNILFYVSTMIMGSKGVDLISLLGAHYLNTPLFEPYQVVTHFFMHAPGIFHILFNMLMLVMFGSHLERIWGAQRFFIFYVISALGSFALYNGIGMYQIMQMKAEIKSLGYDIIEVNNFIVNNQDLSRFDLLNSFAEFAVSKQRPVDDALFLFCYSMKALIPMVGASGAIFGIMAAFAYLFPNTELMLLFPPIPIKAKYLIGGYFVLEVFLGFKDYSGDNIAHFAHVGGAIAGFILVIIWNRNKKTFY